MALKVTTVLMDSADIVLGGAREERKFRHAEYKGFESFAKSRKEVYYLWVPERSP